MNFLRRSARFCFALLLVLGTLLLAVIAYAAWREGGVGVLFEAESTEAAVSGGETDAELRDRLEKNGWTVVRGVETMRLGTRFVRLSRYRLAKYLPLSPLGVTPLGP